jgi:hypothetical protein
MYTFETLNFGEPNPYLSSTNGFQALHSLKFSWGFTLDPQVIFTWILVNQTPYLNDAIGFQVHIGFDLGSRSTLILMMIIFIWIILNLLSFVGSYLNSIGQVGVILILKPFYVCIVIWTVQFDFLGFYGCEFDFQNHSISVLYHLGDPIWLYY